MFWLIALMWYTWSVISHGKECSVGYQVEKMRSSFVNVVSGKMSSSRQSPSMSPYQQGFSLVPLT